MPKARKSLYAVDPDNDPYLRFLSEQEARKREQEARARDFARPVVEPPTPSPTVRSSPTIETPVALPQSSPTVGGSPTVGEQPKPRPRAEYRGGDSRTNNDFFDSELCRLPPLSQLLWFHLNRYRDHGGEYTIVLSWKRLAERFGDSQMHVNSMRRAFLPLERAGLAVKDRHVYGKNGEQGIVFRLYTHGSPTIQSSPTTSGSNKRTALKDNSKVTVCDLCKDQNGFVYVDDLNRSLGVRKCLHGKGK